jgi:hypothetical protein
LTDGILHPMADVPAVAARQDTSMTGNGNSHRRPTDEQRTFFEALVGMRDRYAHRGTDDAEAVIGLRQAIVVANSAMAALSPPPARHFGIAGT